MQYTILLSRNENTGAIEAQEQARFVKSVIEALEVPIEYNPDVPLTVQTKLKFRKSLEFYGINIIGDSDGGVKIYVNTDLIAEFKKPLYKLKEDRSQIDPKKRLYMEMSISFWTAYDAANDKGGDTIKS